MDEVMKIKKGDVIEVHFSNGNVWECVATSNASMEDNAVVDAVMLHSGSIGCVKFESGTKIQPPLYGDTVWVEVKE